MSTVIPHSLTITARAHSTIVFVPGLGDTSLDAAHTMLANQYAVAGYNTVQYSPAALQLHPKGGFWNNTLSAEIEAAFTIVAALQKKTRLSRRIVLHAHSALASVAHAIPGDAYIAAMPIDLRAVGALRRSAIAHNLGRALDGPYDPAMETVSIGIGETKWGYSVSFFRDYDAQALTNLISSAPTLRCFGSQDPLPPQGDSPSSATTDCYLRMAHHFRKPHQATLLAQTGIHWDKGNLL